MPKWYAIVGNTAILVLSIFSFSLSLYMTYRGEFMSMLVSLAIGILLWPGNEFVLNLLKEKK